MKNVRASTLKDEFERVVHARDFPVAERRQHHLSCLDPTCSAKFHYVASHPRKQNTEIIPATFARNPKSQHRENCRFDFAALAQFHNEQKFERNGEYHLRINFPLGGRFADRHPDVAGLSAARRATANRNTDTTPSRSLDHMLRFLEKMFGSLQDEELSNLVLSYQGASAAWQNIFTTPENYARLLVTPGKQNNDARLVVVRPVQEYARNAQGKRRFLCAARDGVQPVIVCENEAAANAVLKNRTVTIAARPFRPLHAARGAEQHVSLYVHDDRQVAAIADALFSPPPQPVFPPQQLALFQR